MTAALVVAGAVVICLVPWLKRAVSGPLAVKSGCQISPRRGVAFDSSS
jgi:hypothetical protein